MLTREFVLSFREAAPYINAFRGKTFVMAINGETVRDGRFPSLAKDINLLVSLGVRIVLVHGARWQIDTLAERAGHAQVFRGDKRSTDSQTLELVKQAVGQTRHEIEAALSASMRHALVPGSQLRVAGGNFLTAQPMGVIDGMDMQYTGSVRRVDSEAMQSRLDAGDLVLVSCIGYSPTGEAFNLTMEEVATHIAIALKAEKLLFMVDSQGVTDSSGEFASTLTAQEAEALIASGNLSGDVAAYMPCAVKAVRQGVARVHMIGRFDDGAILEELFTDGGNGTMLARDPLVKVRNASIDDIGDIIDLIRPLEEQGILVKRSRELLEMEIKSYSVLEHDGKIFGCVAMHPFPEAGMAELACLAVSQQKRDAGFGEELLKHVEYLARAQGMASLFVLTTQTAHWFVERGFVVADISQLPLGRQQLYNYQRRSKVFIKPLR